MQKLKIGLNTSAGQIFRSISVRASWERVHHVTEAVKGTFCGW